MNRFSKAIVALVILLNVGFTSAVLYAFLRIGSEPVAIITAWFAFTTGELWMLANIKKTKVLHNYGSERRDTGETSGD